MRLIQIQPFSGTDNRGVGWHRTQALCTRQQHTDFVDLGEHLYHDETQKVVGYYLLSSIITFKVQFKYDSFFDHYIQSSIQRLGFIGYCLLSSIISYSYV